MEKERNRRFSTEQTMASATKTRMLSVSIRDQSPNNFLSVDRLNSHTSLAEDKSNDEEQTTKADRKMDLKEKVDGSYDLDVSSLGFSRRSEVAFMKETSDMTQKSDQSTSRTLFVKRSDQSPRSDIGLSVKMRRSPQERSLSKQSQFNSGATSQSGRRMSSPGKLLSSPLNEQNSPTRIVTASERKTSRLTQVDHFLDVKKESRDTLPLITKSLETLKTGDQSRRSKSSEDVRNDREQASKWSPQSFNSDKPLSQGLLESKIIPESCPTTTPTFVSEGFSDFVNKAASKNKINVKCSRPDGTKQQNTTPFRLFGNFQIDSDDSSGQRKVRISKRNNRVIYPVHPSGSAEEFKATVGERMKQQTPERKMTMGTQMRIDRRPRSKIPFRRNETPATADEPRSASNSELELELKVKAFLRRHQPTASPKTLKVKREIKRKPSFTANKLRERRSQERIIVNTDTCPSSYRFNQDRSWYYQDRKGKCRYLRVPESPVPPIEWVFSRTSSPL